MEEDFDFLIFVGFDFAGVWADAVSAGGCGFDFVGDCVGGGGRGKVCQIMIDQLFFVPFSKQYKMIRKIELLKLKKIQKRNSHLL